MSSDKDKGLAVTISPEYVKALKNHREACYHGQYDLNDIHTAFIDLIDAIIPEEDNDTGN